MMRWRAASYLSLLLLIFPSPIGHSSTLKYGPFEFEHYSYYIFWIPSPSAGEMGIAVKVLYPKEPRYPEGAPIAIFVPGGVKPGFLGFYPPTWNPHGMIWITLIFPGGWMRCKLPGLGETIIRSGGTYDYRGEACLEALKSVILFAEGKLRNTAGKLISDYVDYPILHENIGLYGSSYGGVTAALTLAKYGEELSAVKYIVFYESPPTSFLATTDLGRVGDDPDPEVDADGDGIPWNDYRNPNYVVGSCTEVSCQIDFSTLRYDPEVGLYLDNDGDGHPTYIGEPPRLLTDVDGSGAIESDEDYILPYWTINRDGEELHVYSRIVAEAAEERGLLSGASEILSLEETEDFWSIRELSGHYDELAEKTSWLRFMQLAFLREHMCPAPDYPNIVVNYNALRGRGFWIRLNPDRCYLDYVTGRVVDWEDNDANIPIDFENAVEHVISDERLNDEERSLIEQASMLEMADRVQYDNWSPNLETVLTESESHREAEGEKATWVNIGPDGGDNYYVYATSRHTVITSTANSAFRSTDGASTWSRITEPNLIDIGFTAIAEVEGVLYAGVGAGRGLMASYDDGESWTRIELDMEALEEGRIYDIVSIIPLSKDHLYLGLKTLRAKSVEAVYELQIEDGRGHIVEHPFPEALPPGCGKVVVRLSYDPDFHGFGPTLFVSRYPDGLYMVTCLDGEWSWVEVFDGETTDVDVAEDIDVVYVGTYGDWIYRGELVEGDWRWVRLNPLEGAVNPPSISGPPIISEVEVDPYNPNRIWWGSPGRLVGIYPVEGRGETLFGVGAWNPETGEWLHSYVEAGWGAFIAVDHHGEGEDPGDYRIEIDSVPGARYAYTCSYSFRCLLKTSDGGRTWRMSYQGLYGDCINEVSYLSSGSLKGSLVVLCQSGIEISGDLGDSWIDDFDVAPSDLRAYFPWCALPYQGELQIEGYPVDLLLITGYPGPEVERREKRCGLIAVSTEYIRGHRGELRRILEGATPLVEEPMVYGLEVDGYIVLALQEGGVGVYNPKTGEYHRSSRGLPEDCSVYKVAYTDVGGERWWLLSTYEGDPDLFKVAGNDHYFWYGPSRIYRARGLLENPEEATWEQIYPSMGNTDRGIVSISLNGSELIALEASGTLIHCPDVTASKPNFKVIKLRCEEGEPETYTDMEAAWKLGVIFISTAGWEGPGVGYITLQEVKGASGILTIHSYNEGLGTRLIRNILWIREEDCLIAGSWWSSTWRIKPTPSDFKAEMAVEGDIDGDGDIDEGDLTILRGAYDKASGEPGFDVRADLNGDGVIDIVDLAILASKMG